MALPPSDFGDSVLAEPGKRKRPADTLEELRAEIALMKEHQLRTAEENRRAFDILNHIQMFLKVMAMLEKVAVFIAKVAAGAAIIWALFKYGVDTAIEAAQKAPPK